MKMAKALLLALLASTSVAHASVLFDFETAQNVGTGPLTSLTGTFDGLTATFTRPGSDFSLRDLPAFDSRAPASFGNLSLSPFTNSASDTPFVVDFSKGLSALSFQAGDFGDDSDTITLEVFSGLNGTGTSLGTTTVNYGTGSFPSDIATLAVTSATPFESAVFIGGSANFPNSVYYDNFIATVSAVPLPGSAPMFGTALVALGAVGYGLKRKKAAAAA